ncbi:DMT family transporter [Microlunatus parietis]|uniref:Drug/metabolite transporter (DMT)-like permease n=1 Tax=Microlunatus parietis TaxID=682979 RepID=A0A7Y9I4Y9_9ACTN|nr:EamA family transporter [Microlunatus parietis]NYE70344.1 drug/metabolite transporter (DMT)-like permease [Microlunatus parietis]
MTLPTVATDVPDPTRTDGRLAPVAALGAVVLWASAFVVIRTTGQHLSPGAMTLGRLVAATLVITPFVLRPGIRARLPRGRDWWLVAAYGVLWFATYTTSVNAAELHLDAGTTALLVNLAPVIITGYATLRMGERLSLPLVLGLVVAFAGTALIAAGQQGHTRSLLGVGLALLAAVLYAVGTLTQKAALRRTDPLTVTWLGCVIGTVACLPFAPMLITELATAPVSAILAVGYLGVFPTALGFTLWAYALTRTPASQLSVSSYLVPAVAVLLAWLLLGELPNPLALVGGALCLAGLGLSRLRRP